MDVGKILKKVGGAAFKSIVPGGGLVIDFVNSFLSKDKQIYSDSTGHEIEGAIAQLPPDKQAVVLEKQFDVEIKEIEEWTNVVRALAESDGVGSSTRPLIAKVMAGLIVFESVIITILLAYAIGKNNFDMIKAVGTSWTFLAFLLGIPASVVNSYFGKRSKEKKARYASASGIPAANIAADILAALRR